MDLAANLTEMGIIYYNVKRGQEAYEMFRGAVQAMCHSSGKDILEMDSIACQMMVDDESIQRVVFKQHPIDIFSLQYDYQRFESSRDQDHNCANGLNISSDASCGRTFLKNKCLHHNESDEPYISKTVFSMEELNQRHFSYNRFDVATSCVLYNMAVVLQRGQVPKPHHSLERALMLYNIAGRLLWDRLGYRVIRGDKMTSELYMAVLNNTGYLLHELGLYKASRILFIRLKEYIANLPPPASTAEKQERHEYKLNILLFNRNLSTAGAA